MSGENPHPTDPPQRDPRLPRETEPCLEKCHSPEATSGADEQEMIEGVEALDALLGRAARPILRAGFSERVIAAVQPEDVTRLGTSPAVQSGTPSTELWRICTALAAAIALCFGAAFLCTPPKTVVPDEDPLVSALRSPGLVDDDLLVVAQLGEVLEAELTANNSVWLEHP